MRSVVLADTAGEASGAEQVHERGHRAETAWTLGRCGEFCRTAVPR